MAARGLLLAFLLLGLNCSALLADFPEHVWSARYGDVDNDNGFAVAVDAADNVYLTGAFRLSVDFGGDILTADGTLSDIYLVKFDASGSHLWSQGFGDDDWQAGTALATDSAGNVVITGYSYGTVDFGGGPLPCDYEDMILAKFDSNGNHIWSQYFSGNIYAESICTDAAGNVIVAGSFYGTVDFGGGPFVGSGDSMFLVKFDAAGNHIWSHNYGDSSVAWDVTVDDAGNIYIAGQFSDTIDFGTGVLASAGSEDVFLAKIGPDGLGVWSNRYGDGSSQSGTCLAVGSSGCIVIAGRFTGSLDFGGGPLNYFGDLLTDVFLAKLDASGNHIWSRKYGAEEHQAIFSVVLDSSENIYVTGNNYGNVDFGGGTISAVGTADIILAAIDRNGAHIWSKGYGSAVVSTGRDLAIDHQDNLLLTGNFRDDVDFGGGILSSAGYLDIVLAKYGETSFFTDIGAPLPPLSQMSASWGDYDGDGDLDVLLCGDIGTVRMTRIYRNDAGTLVDIAAPLTGVSNGCVAWGDYDNDNDLDALISGMADVGPVTKIYRNDPGGFVEAPVSLLGLASEGSDRYHCWGDYDNDGDLDILIVGMDSAWNRQAKIFRNDGSDVFADTGIPLEDVESGSVEWGDYDNDGDLDILLTGYTDPWWETIVYRNDGQDQFVDVGAGLQEVYMASAAWGDYDADGDLDVALTGCIDLPVHPVPISKIYRNDSGSFVDIGADLVAVLRGSVDWGDCDGDGDLDLALSGGNGTSTLYHGAVYRNDGMAFTNIGAGLSGGVYCAMDWGDFDNDGDLDLLYAGYNPTEGDFLKVYRNEVDAGNSSPLAPAGLDASAGADHTVTFSWSPSSDAETPGPSLTYGLRIGTTPGGGEIVSATADAATGQRYLPQRGNVGHNTSWTIHGLVAGTTYYWSVQAVDNNYAGSVFAAEQTFEPPAGFVPQPQTVTVDGSNDFLPENRFDEDPADTQHPQLDIGDVYMTNDQDDLYIGFDYDMGGWTQVQIGIAIDVETPDGGTDDPWAHKIEWSQAEKRPDYVYYVNMDNNWQAGYKWEGKGWTETVTQGVGALGWITSTTFLELAVPLDSLQIDYGEYLNLEVWVTQFGSSKGPLDCAINDAVQLSTPDTTIWDVDTPVSLTQYQRCRIIGTPTGIGSSQELPAGFLLHQNRPNPFNPMTGISFALPRATQVNLCVYAIDGRLVATLKRGFLAAGTHEVTWTGQDDRERAVPSGVYFYRLQTDRYSQTKRMTLIR